MKVTYTRKGDYLLPDLYLEKDENYGRLGRYGILRYFKYSLLLLVINSSVNFISLISML